MEDYTPPPIEGSDWNGAVGTVWRLHQIKCLLDACGVSESYTLHKHFKILKAYYRELYPILAKDKREAIKLTLKECKDIIVKCSASQTYNKLDEDIMENLELELRVIDQELDLNLPTRGDNRFGMMRKGR